MSSTALKPESSLEISVEDQSAAISRALRRAAKQARSPVLTISGGTGFRARKGERLFRMGMFVSFLLCVVAPFVILTVYWAAVASPQYSTEIKFAVRSGENASLGALTGFLGLGLSTQAQNTQIVSSYIRSPTAVEALQKTHDLRMIYGQKDIDYFSRLSEKASGEELEKYWRKHVQVSLEVLSGIVSVDVHAFTAQDSFTLAAAIMKLSEDLVNNLSTQSRRDVAQHAQIELDRAEAQLKTASADMRDARNAEGVLDAASSAEAINKLITSLRLALSDAEQTLEAQTKFSATSPQVALTKTKIATLKEQIANYSNQIAGGGNAQNMAEHLNHLARAQVEVDLARQQYAMAAANFESARLALSTKEAYFAVFQPPALPQTPLYPRRLWNWFLTFSPCLVLWGVLASLAVLARDHMAK